MIAWRSNVYKAIGGFVSSTRSRAVQMVGTLIVTWLNLRNLSCYENNQAYGVLRAQDLISSAPGASRSDHIPPHVTVKLQTLDGSSRRRGITLHA